MAGKQASQNQVRKRTQVKKAKEGGGDGREEDRQLAAIEAEGRNEDGAEGKDKKSQEKRKPLRNGASTLECFNR